MSYYDNHLIQIKSNIIQNYSSFFVEKQLLAIPTPFFEIFSKVIGKF